MPSVVTATRKRELLSAAGCCAALLLCLAVANPFVNSAFNDDWAYSHVALRLAQTGKLEYGGWGSPAILFQSAWAALFSKLFGFSFNLLRAVTIPFAMGAVLLTYLLARKVGLRKDLAHFAALTFAVSPLLLPLAGSFMTEPYACFFSLLCVYSAVCSAEAETPTSAKYWLWVVTVAGILGGSDRQTVWLAPLVLLPFLVWIRRSDRKFLIHFAGAYTACLVLFAVILFKFSPKYGPIEITGRQWVSLLILNGREGTHYVASVLLVSTLMSLPVLLCAQPLWGRLKLQHFGIVLLICVVVFDYLRSGFGLGLGIAPFLGNILSPQGLIDLGSGGLGTRPIVLRVLVRYAITIFLLFAAAAWIYSARSGIRMDKLSKPASLIFGFFALPYVLLLIPGALLTYCYDRYALPLLPLFLICLLLPLQRSILRIPWAAWACILVFACYGTAITHDHARNVEARTTAANQCAARGIPPLHVSAGFERDGWLQLQTTGKVGTMLYGIDTAPDYNKFWFWYYSRAITPDYVVVSSDLTAVPRNAILTVPFTTWLPFSRQAAYVVRREDILKPKVVN